MYGVTESSPVQFIFLINILSGIGAGYSKGNDEYYDSEYGDYDHSGDNDEYQLLLLVKYFLYILRAVPSFS